MQKMIFREILNPDGTIQYFMGNSYENLKLVSKKTYDTLILNETKLSQTEKDIENISKNINSPTSHEDGISECICEDCNYYLNLIEDIKELPIEDSIELLRSEMMYKISKNVLLNQQTLIDSYAKEFSKISALVDIKLESIEDEYLNNYGDFDEDDYE